MAFVELRMKQKLAFFLKGSLFLILGLGLFFMIISFDPEDPSIHRSLKGTAHNLLGEFGAYYADPLLQIMGLSVFLWVGILCFWSLCFFRFRGVKHIYYRLLALCGSTLCASSFFHAMPLPKTWIYKSMGGLLGTYLHGHITLYMSPFFFYFLAFLGMIMGSWFITDSPFKPLLQKIRFTPSLKFLTQHKQEKIFEKISPSLTLSPRKSSSLPTPIAIKKKKEILKEFFTSSENTSKKYDDKVEDIQENMEDNTALLPSLSLLAALSPSHTKTALSEQALQEQATKLRKVLEDFGIQGSIGDIRPGPVVTLYELEPAAGVKSSRVIGLSEDIARSMSAHSARIAVIPGKNALGIELPNTHREIVCFKFLLEKEEYRNPSTKLPLALGQDIGGTPIIVDLARMPHLLVAGTTGSGKSVAINSMILSLLYRLTADECKFIMIDPKMLELSVYDGIPHLLCPVVTEPAKAVVALKWAVREMEQRYRLMSNLGVRNIAGYNKRIEDALQKGEHLKRTVQTGFEEGSGTPIIESVPLDMTLLPFIVIIVDEMADLMLVAGKEIESSIQRLAQMARAAGIHLITATQRPSVDVITGVIKANFPVRISFQVTSRIDSRTILGEQGAEQLLGMGDMLYMTGGARIMRVHGPFVDDHEVERVVDFLKTTGEPCYMEEITQEADEESASGGENASGSEDDVLYDKAVAIVCRDKKASISHVQRQLRLGYNRAAILIERMEKEGVVSLPNHSGRREVLGGRNDYN